MSLKDKFLNGTVTQLRYVSNGNLIRSGLSSLVPPTHPGGNVKYLSRRPYDNVFVFEAQRKAAQQARYWAHKLATDATQKLVDRINAQNRQQAATVDPSVVTLVENQYNKQNSYGSIRITGDGGQAQVFAYRDNGDIATDALILSFEDADPYKYTATIAGNAGTQTVTHTNVTTRFFIDVTPHISVQSAKQLLLTKVQGRDYSRKELVGGGDLVFTVSGNIASQSAFGKAGSDARREYPSAEVLAFEQIMQHNGIVKVSHYMFGNLSVTNCIIQDWSLGRQEYANLQPYSFTCVAVEPDSEVAASDVISLLDRTVALSTEEKWYNAVINAKLAERVGDTASQVASQTVASTPSLVKQLINNI